MKFNIKIALTISFVAACILYLYMLATVTNDIVLRNAFKPVPILILLMLYSFESKKIDPLVISMFATMVIADIINNTINMFHIAILIYGIANLFLIKIIANLLKKDAKKQILKYFLLAIMLFIIVFVFVVQNKGKSFYPIIFYGLTMSLAFAISLSNYLHNMNVANEVLLIAMGIRVISDSIYAVVIFNVSNVYFDVASLSIYMLSCYVFYRGFILKDKIIN
ncbi:lysoplasmalogenase family protein [Tenacibaculum amylolyticum]|uniref:lysoplasmalogenase family protein n=1 Tax=Tenacibaculum amylolyticum TaxID=104269 RepID=UPI003894E85D